MNLPSSDQIAAMTPMMRQFYELKARADDAILFFRMGDFYEIFGEDAEEVAPKLELVLTSRERGDKNKIPFCGVPHHSAKNYWLKLLKMGYKVSLADQVENPQDAKGIVKRDIIRVFTPGCIDELEGLESDAPNYLMAVYEEPTKKTWSIVIADISTGELRCGNFNEASELSALTERFRPRELLVRRFYHDEAKNILYSYLAQEKLSFGFLPEAILRDKDEQQRLLKLVLGKSKLEEQPCGEIVGGQELLASVLNYLQSLYAGLSQFLCVKPLNDPQTMILDETARRDLEIFETARRRQINGSLYREINQTLSPMGARLLRYSLAYPLLDQNKIAQRQTGVETLLKLNADEFNNIRQLLRGAVDIERLATRVYAGTAQPAEIAKIRTTLAKAANLLELLHFANKDDAQGLLADVFRGLASCQRPLKLLQDTICEQPGTLGSSLDIFCEGYDLAFDEKRQLSRNGEAEIANYEERLRRETGINSLKVKNHKTFGLLIEITRSNIARVPQHFIRRQTMVNGERYSTIELNELGDVLASATEKAVALELELYAILLKELAQYKVEMRDVAEAIATLDLLQSFAWQAREGDFCKPEFSQDQTLHLIASRHPVVERFVGRHQFVANDIAMSSDRKQLLITGPNMAGKSTVMRQTAISAILHQIGSFIPAQKAVMPLFDRIFTRVGASDDLSRGQSTFMVEMAEAAHILRQASARSLVILDEVGRGTSTQDGMAIASAILEELARHVRCYALFATHYHELVPLAEQFSSVRMVQTEVIEKADHVIFTHRLVDGASGSSFGLEVAKIAGLPTRVIDRAKVFLTQHQEMERGVMNSAPNTNRSNAESGLFRQSPTAYGFADCSDYEDLGYLKEIAVRLEKIKIHRTTPMQALNILNDLKSLQTAKQQVELFPGEPN